MMKFSIILAHGGKPHTFHDLWHEWGLEPGVLIPLALSAASPSK